MLNSSKQMQAKDPKSRAGPDVAVKTIDSSSSSESDSSTDDESSTESGSDEESTETMRQQILNDVCSSLVSLHSLCIAVVVLFKLRWFQIA
jgi:hypothetical protein